MKIITTHVDPDFDAFASAVAAQRLYPDHRIVIEGRLNPELDKYLKGRKIFYPYYSFRELNIESVSSMIIVDNSDNTHLGGLKELAKTATKLLYIDHHTGLIRGKDRTTIICEELGACTTLLVKLLRKDRVRLLPGDATLFATALYRETNRFLNRNTKPADLQAAAWLLESGASLDDVGFHGGQLLDKKQLELFGKLVNSLKIMEIGGIALAVVEEYWRNFPYGLRTLIEGLWNFLGEDNLLVLLHIGNRMFFFGRSRYGEIDFSCITNKAKAYSSFNYLDDLEPTLLREKVITALMSCTSKVTRAGDIMSAPVRTVLAEMELSDVLKIMEHTGHNGLPVIEENKLVGIVTKKEIEMAIKHGLNRRTVKGIMRKDLITASVSDPIDELKRKMVENDVGRILILDHGILQGIVTRTDIMRSPYELAAKRKLPTSYDQSELIRVDVSRLMEERIENRILTILRFIGVVGTETAMPVYIVGGFVRDLFLNQHNFDIDIVVEGSANDFARAFSRYFDARVVEHREFLTSSIYMKDGFKIDIATARTEYYDGPGVLPNVEMSNIKKDLYRRDFSINAMAIKLNQEEFGTLIDFFGCRKDIINGNIKILHSLSFVEDSTRILRAIRFEQRFGFEIEPHTLGFLKECVTEGYLERVTGGRIREELEKVFDEVDPLKSLNRMNELGILQHIYGCGVSGELLGTAAVRLFSRSERNERERFSYNKFYMTSMILLSASGKVQISSFIGRYGFPKKFSDTLDEGKRIIDRLKNLTSRGFPDLYRSIKTLKTQVYLFVDSFLEDELSLFFFEYVKTVRDLKLEVSGKDLMMKFHLSGGPLISEILDELKCARLGGLPPDREMDFARRFIEGKKSKLH